jgi:N-acylneuraminate cytidylyltransferase
MCKIPSPQEYDARVDLKAVIPARRGSKGIPNKNLQTVGGISLLERIVGTAKEFGVFSEIIVSSNSFPILELAQNLGVSALERPETLSGDKSRAREVVEHVLITREINSKDDQVIFYLQPTSPFTTVDTLSQILTKLQNTKRPVFTARVADPPSKLLVVDEQMLAGAWQENGNPTSNRQEIEETYMATGGCYGFSVGDFYRSGDIPVIGAEAHLVKWPEYIDIDSVDDLNAANLIDQHRGFV